MPLARPAAAAKAPLQLQWGEARFGGPYLAAGLCPCRAQGQFLVDLLKVEEGLHRPGEADLLLRGEQGNPADGTQVQADGVAGAAVWLLWRRHGLGGSR